MTKPPLVRAVKARPPATLDIKWSTGETLPVDVSRLVRRYKLYAPLRTPARFRKAKADPWGHAVVWPGGVDMGSRSALRAGARAGGPVGAGTLPGMDGGTGAFPKRGGGRARFVAANDRPLPRWQPPHSACRGARLRAAEGDVAAPRRLKSRTAATAYQYIRLTPRVGRPRRADRG